MKFLMAVLKIRDLLKSVFKDRKAESTEVTSPDTDIVRHPAEYQLR
jgi:hypothetical protein